MLHNRTMYYTHFSPNFSFYAFFLLLSCNSMRALNTLCCTTRWKYLCTAFQWDVYQMQRLSLLTSYCFSLTISQSASEMKINLLTAIHWICTLLEIIENLLWECVDIKNVDKKLYVGDFLGKIRTDFGDFWYF